MPYSIPTLWVLRFVQNTPLKNRMKPLEQSYKLQIGGFVGTSIYYSQKANYCAESVFMLTYL